LAMGAPMVPRPRNPIFMMDPFYRRDAAAGKGCPEHSHKSAA
jgi:hypothetical protein